MKPEFSVLIVGYRSLSIVGDCIQSILGGNFSNFELLFLDNNSPEDEFEFVQQHFGSDPRVRVFRSESNRYFAGGMNLLAGNARGNFVVLVNPDAVAVPEFLESFYRSNQNAPIQVGMGELRRFDAPHEIQSAGILLTRVGLVRQLPKVEPLQRTRIDGANGACFIVKAEIFKNLGMFDESFEMYFEETDFCWRARLAGFSIELLPGAVLYHKEGGSSEGHGDDRRQYRFIRNRIWSYAKNCRERPRWVFIAFHCSMVAMEVVRLFVKGAYPMAKAHADALADGLAGLIRRKDRVKAL